MKKKVYIGIITTVILCTILSCIICFISHKEVNHIQFENTDFNVEDIKSKQMEDMKIEKFSAGADEFGRALILTPNGYVYEWLGDQDEQLLKIEKLKNIKQVEVGIGFMYALEENGDLYRREIKADRNIKSKDFKKYYNDSDIKRIDFHYENLTFIKESNLQYVLDEMEQIEIYNTYTFNKIIDICNIETIDYVLDKYGILWKIENGIEDSSKPEEMRKNICKIMSRGNELIAIDKKGEQISWRQNEKGKLFAAEHQEAYNKYSKEIVMDDDYLFTTDGHLYYIRYGMEEVIFKDRIVYYNKQIFLTNSGDVYYTKDGYKHTFIMNIYDIKEDDDEITLECEKSSMQGLIANNSTYLMYIDENHALYEYRNKKVKRRSDIKDASIVAISNDSNYIIDQNGNVYAEKRNNQTALGFESLNIANIKNIKSSAYWNIVVLMQENQIEILDDGRISLQYDIKYNDIANICIFDGCIIFLNKNGTLWASNSLEECDEQLNFREIASNISNIEANQNYLLVIDMDGIGYFFYDSKFKLYEKSKGFENVKITSNDYCVDYYGHVWNMNSDDRSIIFDEENVIYLANDFFMTETGNLYKINLSEYRNIQVEFLLNIKECKNIPDKKISYTTYDLNNKISLEHTCEYDIQKYSEISGYIYCEEYREGLISVSKEINDELQWGFVDIDGNEVIPCIYDSVNSFCDGVARVEKDNISYDIDKAGNILNKFEEWDEVIGKYSEGLASIEINNKIGFIDEKRNVVIEPQFEPSILGRTPYVFSQGLCRVEKDSKIGMIDTTGKMVIPNSYNYLDKFSENLARFSIDGKKWGFMDRNGDCVFEPIFDYAYAFSHGLAFVSIFDSTQKNVDDNWYIVNTEGKFLDATFDNLISLVPVSNDIFGFVDKEGGTGFIDIYGDVLYENQNKDIVVTFLGSEENVIGICTKNKLYIYKVLEK